MRLPTCFVPTFVAIQGLRREPVSAQQHLTHRSVQVIETKQP